MDKEEFTNLHSCSFKVDERIVVLEKKWADYYREAAQCSNQFAAHLRKELKRWCDFNYTKEEIRTAKKSALYFLEKRNEL